MNVEDSGTFGSVYLDLPADKSDALVSDLGAHSRFIFSGHTTSKKLAEVLAAFSRHGFEVFGTSTADKTLIYTLAAKSSTST